jgi:hypothetical protein
MIALYGEKAYDFVPKTFSYPSELDKLKKEMKKRPG